VTNGSRTDAKQTSREVPVEKEFRQADPLRTTAARPSCGQSGRHRRFTLQSRPMSHAPSVVTAHSPGGRQGGGGTTRPGVLWSGPAPFGGTPGRGDLATPRHPWGERWASGEVARVVVRFEWRRPLKAHHSAGHCQHTWRRLSLPLARCCYAACRANDAHTVLNPGRSVVTPHS
jgi:hypothetical protein